jgi:two-component system cell cycle sensor histidine kinase/response regulator CckA
MRTSLVLDDEPAIRNLITTILRHEDFRIVEAENGARGLEIMQEMGEQIDLIISDIRMPEVDGVAFARSVRRLHPRVPIILMSGYTECEATLDFDGFVEKPFAVRKLLEVVRRAVAQAGTRAA